MYIHINVTTQHPRLVITLKVYRFCFLPVVYSTFSVVETHNSLGLGVLNLIGILRNTVISLHSQSYLKYGFLKCRMRKNIM